MKKKLVLLTTLILVGVIVVATVILGLVKKDYSPSVQTNFQSVTITNSGNSSFSRSFGRLDEGKEFDKIVEEYNNSFKQSMLASLFSGNSSNKITVEHSYSIPSMSGYKMLWTLNQNGEEIMTTDTEKLEKVNELIVGVEDSNSFKQVTIYARIQNSTNTYLKITTKANFEALFDLLEDL